MHISNASAGLKLRTQSTNQRHPLRLPSLRRIRAILRYQPCPYGEFDLLKAYLAGAAMTVCTVLPFVLPILQHAFG